MLFLEHLEDNALVIFKVEDLAKARDTFDTKGIKFLDEKQLYQP